jgi:uncharacterized membrane protein
MMNKFWPAIAMLTVLAVLAAATLTDVRFKVATLAVLGMFAAKIAINRRKQLLEKSSKS